MSNPCPPVDSCACNSHCCVADAETHYELSFANAAPTWADTSVNGTLATRTAIEIYNDGTIDFQYIANNAAFAYGQGRTIKPNTGVALAIGPKTRHYLLCSTAGPCSAHITELGSASV
jgi:hypothetical protein